VEKNPLFEILQFLRRLDSEFLAQFTTQLLVCTERLSLPAGPIERQHQRSGQAFPSRMLVDQPLQIANDFALAALGNQQLETLLHRPQPQLAQAEYLGVGEFVVGEVGIGITAPQRQRFIEQLHRPDRVRVTGLPSFRQQRLKSKSIETGQSHIEHIPRRTGRNSPLLALIAVRLQRITQLRNVEPQSPQPTRRLLITPHQLQQPIRRHHLIGVNQQHRQQGTLLRGINLDRLAIRHDLQRTENPELHLAMHGDPLFTPMPDRGQCRMWHTRLR